MKRSLYCIIAIFLVSFQCVAAQSDAKAKGIIIAYKGTNIESLITESQKAIDINVSYKTLSQSMQLYLLESTNQVALFRFLENHNDITHLSFDAETTPRIKPNDSRLTEQYAHNFIKSYEAWDVTTGGKTALQTDIVIAILDDGFQYEHEDLKDNLWVNVGEKPGDGIDNDGNGFKDDINGWNTRTNTGVQDIKSHGTYIAGCIGAKGNNGKGVTGVNWNVKLMLITTGTQISQVIQSYDYALTQRRLFNSSGGKKGSFVVATSYSAGLPKAWPEDQPAWCPIYETLGLEGILSVTATTNDDNNVDVVGDLPSTCPSNFLIVVNSSDEKDELEEITGFGPKYVDISAPGERILTTNNGSNLYIFESGTSLATPIVSGAVALLYSLPCKAFADQALGDPSDIALKVKEAIMTSVDKKQSMNGLTVSGGRLNIFKSLVNLQTNFTDCDAILEPGESLSIITADYRQNGLVDIKYESPTREQKSFYVNDALGRLITSGTFNALTQGTLTVTLPIAKNTGVYFVTIYDDVTSSTKSFVIAF
jgi:subtilisin family serine protease